MRFVVIALAVLLLVIAMLIVGRRPFYRQTGESISQKSIAVLPFENLNRDPDNAYFADGSFTRRRGVRSLRVAKRLQVERLYPAPVDAMFAALVPT